MIQDARTPAYCSQQHRKRPLNSSEKILIQCEQKRALNEVSSDRIHGHSDMNEDFTVAKRFGALRLLDAKAYLNEKDCLKSSNAANFEANLKKEQSEVKLQPKTHTPANGERIEMRMRITPYLR